MSTDSPTTWARSKLATARTRAAGNIGTLLRQLVPEAMPRVPDASIYGFIANSDGPTENTTETTSVAFHEVGLFGTPAGPRDGPAPNPDPAAPNNAYGRLAHSALVVRLLGGDGATMVPNAWKDPAHLADQIAVGLADLLGNYLTVRAALPAALKPDGDQTPFDVYGVALMFGGWSAGASRMARWVNRYATAVAEVQGRARWGALLNAALRDPTSGTRSPASSTDPHTAPAYSLLRCWQKLMVGELLAPTMGEDASWYATGLDPESAAEARLVALVNGTPVGSGVPEVTFTPPGGLGPGSSTALRNGLILGGASVLGLGLGVGLELWRSG